MPSIRILLPLLLLFITSCTNSSPATSAKQSTPAALPIHPATPVVTVTRCQTFAADFQQFFHEHFYPKDEVYYDHGSMTLTELQLHLHMPDFITALPSQSLTFFSFTDDLGTDLLPAANSGSWPQFDRSSLGQISPDRHQVLITIYSQTAPASGATRLILHGQIAVPVGRNRFIGDYPNSSVAIGSQIAMNPLILTLTSAQIDPPRKDSNYDRMIPAHYDYRWRAEGPLDLLESIQFLDAAGKPLPASINQQLVGYDNTVYATLEVPLDPAHLRLIFYRSIETVQVPVDISVSLAGFAPAQAATTMPATSKPASRPINPIRVMAIKTGAPIDKSLWKRDPIMDPPVELPQALIDQPGILISCAALVPDAYIADFNAADVVVDTAVDDHGTNLRPALAIYPGFNDENSPPPEKTRPSIDRHACAFTAQLLTPPHPAAKSITLSGHLTVQVARAPESVTFPAANLQPGQSFKVGPHTITLTEIETTRKPLRYDFDQAENSLIQSIVFLDAAGNPLRDQHYYKYKAPAIVQHTIYEGQPAPASLRITYFPDPKPRQIPFVLTATLGH